MGSVFKRGPNQQLLYTSLAGSNKPWTNPNNAATSNNIYTTAALVSSGLSKTNLIQNNNTYFSSGVSGTQIPLEAVIIGVQVDIERSFSIQTNAGVPQDLIVQILDGTNTSNNKASLDLWPSADAYASYGGSGDTWGLPMSTLNPVAMTTGSLFKVNVAAQIVQDPNGGGDPNSTFNCTARIDHIRVSCWFTWLDGLYMVGSL